MQAIISYPRKASAFTATVVAPTANGCVGTYRGDVQIHDAFHHVACEGLLLTGRDVDFDAHRVLVHADRRGRRKVGNETQALLVPSDWCRKVVLLDDHTEV